jgi:hypothetical protein
MPERQLKGFVITQSESRFALRSRQWFDLAIGELNLVGSQMLKTAAITVVKPPNTEYCPNHLLFSTSVNQMRFDLVVTAEVVNRAG